MTPETIDAIKEALAPAFATIGQGGAYAWEIAVKGQFAEGVAMLTLGIILSILLGGFVFFFRKKDFWWDDYLEMPHFHAMFIGIGLFVAVIFIPVLIYDGLFHVLAPEYKALEFFVQTVKS